MNALDINFVQRRRLGSSLGVLLLATGMVAAVLVGSDYLAVSDELARVEQKQARLQKTQASPVRRDNPAPASQDDKQFVDPVMSQLQLPWSAILQEIEARTGPAVALLDLEAQGQARTLHLTGEAKSMSDVVAYVSRLRESPLIEAAHLSHHEEVQAQSVTVIRFSLDATWKAPS